MAVAAAAAAAVIVCCLAGIVATGPAACTPGEADVGFLDRLHMLDSRDTADVDIFGPSIATMRHSAARRSLLEEVVVAVAVAAVHIEDHVQRLNQGVRPNRTRTRILLRSRHPRGNGLPQRDRHDC